MKSTDSHAPAAMRCMPGDLAVIVSAPITGLDFLIGGHLLCIDLCRAPLAMLIDPVWHIAPLSQALAASSISHLPDSCLRPLRDGPGRDETMEWAPVPRTQKIAPVGRPKFGVTS